MQLLKKIILLSIFFVFHIPSSYAVTVYPKKMIITVPVADLRTAPVAPTNIMLPTSSQTNEYQGSQLLLNEFVVAHRGYVDRQGIKWYQVSALQQLRYSLEFGWHGFLGWIRADCAEVIDVYPVCTGVVKTFLADLKKKSGKKLCTLSLGTRLQTYKAAKKSDLEVTMPDGSTAFIDQKNVFYVEPTIEESEMVLRRNLLSTAREFLGCYYSWGGRSAQNDAWSVSSVDCSSFMNLVFAAQGLQIPRGAHDQYLICDKLKHGKNMQPGDLIFLCPNHHKAGRMTHVMMYVGDGMLIESSLSGDKKVSIVPFKQRIGLSHDSMKAGDSSTAVTTRGVLDKQYYVYFGSICSNKSLLQRLRTNFLNVKYSVK